MRRLPAIVIVWGAFITFSAGAETPRWLDGPVAWLPAIADAPEGYAVAWLRPEPGLHANSIQFAVFDRGGDTVVEPVRVGAEGRAGEPRFCCLNLLQLQRRANGYLLLAQDGIAEIWSLTLDARGRPERVWTRLAALPEVYPMDSVAVAGGYVLTYGDWWGWWRNFAMGLTPHGLPRDHAQQLNVRTAVGDQVSGGALWDTRVDGTGSEIYAAWHLFGEGIRLQRLDSQGVPKGDPQLVQPTGECVRELDIAEVGTSQAIVYSAGCDQKDLFLRMRSAAGEIAPAVRLTSAPYDEGYGRCFGLYRSLHAVSGGDDRIGVLYRAYPRGSSDCSGPWVFAEYDTSGQVLGESRDLFEIHGMTSDVDVSFIRDTASGVYVVSWYGNGPEGYGAYFVSLRP